MQNDNHMSENTYTTPKEPTVLTIFGITGNLSKIKLLPALYELLAYGHLPECFTVVGIMRDPSASLDTVMHEVEIAMLRQGKECRPEIMAQLKAMVRPFVMDSTNANDFNRLAELLADIDREHSTAHQRIFYLAIPPAIFTSVIGNLAAAGLNAEPNGKASRIFVEKPFGSDLESAKALVRYMAEHFEERQIYRIDHYLAKEMAQNILMYRFNNPLLAKVWNGSAVTGITVRATEKIDIEGRADFYEPMGALRDFVQSHLLQVIALILMERPERFDAAHIHAGKLRVLQTVQIDQTRPAVRGQYEGYKSEVNNPTSVTETYTRLHVTANTDTWRGVPITLETGKALQERRTEIELTFSTPEQAKNTLQIQVQPTEAMMLTLAAKKPGFSTDMEPVTMAYHYTSSFGGKNPDAYERVLYDAVVGDQTLFATSQEVIRCWEIIQPLLDEWQGSAAHLVEYKKGSAGPA